ncbi:MAG: 2-oxoacid:acceptor oxidoreductase family protein, partial [Planctomycetota bacterium]
ALQTQSYGSESRGGACKSDVVISDGEILDLAPSDTDVLLVMSQPALDKYIANLRKNGSLIYDSDLVIPGKITGKTFGLGATDIAHKIFGRDVVANVIMIGYLAGLTKVVTQRSLRRAISENVPPKTQDINLKAFDEGYNRGATQM